MNTGHRQDTTKEALTAGSEGYGFYSYILAGILLGWGADHWWGTSPVFIGVGLVVGAAMGFWKLWCYFRGSGG